MFVRVMLLGQTPLSRPNHKRARVGADFQSFIVSFVMHR